jgi:serine/threonine-protein kinase RsbW
LIEPLTTHVMIKVPARPQYVKVLRSIVASVAASLDFSLERIDDLKMAVGEASSQLLDVSPPGGTLLVEADPVNGGLRVDVAIDAGDFLWPPEEIESTLTWRVLSTVATDIDFGKSAEGAFVRLLVTATAPEHV